MKTIKSTIKYGDTVIVDQLVEHSPIQIVYNNNLIHRLYTNGDQIVLNTENKVCGYNIVIGSKELATEGKNLLDNITCFLESDWEDPVQDGDVLTITQAFGISQEGEVLILT